MSFPIGSRVRLRKDSMYWGQSNGSMGTVLSNFPEQGQTWHNVDWDISDRFHNYRTQDLAPIGIMHGEEFSEQNKQKERL